MRRFVVALSPLLALACSSPTTSASRVEGVWTLSSTPFTAAEPRSLSLHQQGTTVTGVGTTLGVDAPLQLAVTGTIQDTTLDLQLGSASNGTGAGRITAVLTSSDQLVGLFTVADNFGGGADSVTYVRQ